MPVRRVELGPIGEVVKANIRDIRIERDLTQVQLATLSGLPAQAITEIENGARRVTADDLVGVAAALKVSTTRLLTERS